MVNKKNFKIISIIITLFIISTLISFNTISTKASNVATQPNFKITELKATPDSAKVGEDILVSGKIVPEDFEISAVPKEIVLVLDVSGSMGDRIGNKNSNPKKIDELKNAAKAFIDTMKEVANLKIGVVAYSSIATINPYKKIGSKSIDTVDESFKHNVNNYTSLQENFLKSNDLRLETIIDILNPLGGTNTGEGLRKAIYMLENGDKYASKTIILMSDGLPTFYSVEGRNKNEYTKIDNSEPKIAGNGLGNDINSINYANNIGKKIKERNYNVFSIGYGLEKNGVDNLKQIHAYMRGLKSSDESKEDNGFFEKSDGSITEIFTQIAENIKNSYELKQISLDIGLTEGFTLNIGGNRIEIGNINYKKVSEDKNTGKIGYHAEPVNFSFIVKGKQEGYQAIFNNIKINYLWEEAIKSIDINQGVPVTITPNELPSISAKLLSNDKIEIKRNGEITLKYQITPEDFIYNNTSNSGNVDVVVVVELGKKSADMEGLKNGIKNKLTDEFQNSKNARFSFITFNKDKNELVTSLKSFENSTNYPHDIREAINSFNEGNIFDSSTKDISEAIYMASEELSRNSRATATKNIVIISNNDIMYNDKTALSIKQKGYNILSLSLETEDLNKNLYKLHDRLGGKVDDIYTINNNYNDINNNKMPLITQKIKGYAAAKPYLFNPIINLNLGNNFNPESGIVRSTEFGKNNIGIVEIPTITYNLTQNNNYHAESKIIEIKIKANNLLPGTYTFGDIVDNKMTYKTILNKDISMTIKTPIITVKEEVKDITHGLYNGINKGQFSIQQNNGVSPFEIAQGSTVTFGSSFTFSGSSTEFNLNVDSKFSTLNTSNIKIYKISKDSSGNSTLKELDATNKDIVDNGNNNFKLSIKNITDTSTDMLVIYQGKIKEDIGVGQTLTNNIVFGSTPTTVTIVTPKQSTDSPTLPDLF